MQSDFMDDVARHLQVSTINVSFPTADDDPCSKRIFLNSSDPGLMTMLQKSEQSFSSSFCAIVDDLISDLSFFR